MFRVDVGVFLGGARTHTRIANAYSNTSRNRSASRTRRRRKSLPFRYTVTRSISICTTLIAGRAPVGFFLRVHVPTQAQVAPKFVVSSVEPITSSIDTITSPAPSTSYPHPSQRIEGVASPDMIQRHCRNSLQHIYTKKMGENPGWYDDVAVVGAFLKMGITR